MKNGSPLRRNIARPLETLRNEKGPGAYHNLDKDVREEKIIRDKETKCNDVLDTTRKNIHSVFFWKGETIEYCGI